MDKLAAMRVFVKVVDLGSFTRAAEALEISRTMATTHVARLEQHLRTRLLHRTTRRLSLTEAGTAYYEKCAALLAEIETLEESLEAMSEEPRGVLKVSAPVSFAQMHEAFAEYMERHPQVKLDVNLNDRAVDLVEEGYDVAIRVASQVEPGLVARRIASIPMRLCASPAYLKRRGTPREPVDLAAHECMGYAYWSSGVTWPLEGADGRTVEVRLRPQIRTNNGDMMRVLALHGHGIAILPHFLAAADLEAKRLREVLPAWKAGERGIFAVYPSRKYLSTKVRTLVDFLVKRFGSRPSW